MTKGRQRFQTRHEKKMAEAPAPIKEPTPPAHDVTERPGVPLMPLPPTLDNPTVPQEAQEGAPVAVKPVGILKSINVSIIDFETHPGTLCFEIVVQVDDKEPIIKNIKLPLHTFRGYFDSIWKDTGAAIKEAVG